MFRKSCFYLLLFLFSLSEGYGQDQVRIDSLSNELHQIQNDTLKIEIHLKLSSKYLFLNPTLSLTHANQALELSRGIGIKETIVQSLIRVGLFHMYQGDYEIAIKGFLDALKLAEEYPKLKNDVLANLGLVYGYLGEDDKALKYLTLAFLNDSLNNDTISMADNLGNMGLALASMGLFDKALRIDKRSLAMQEKANNLEGIATSASNIAGIYYRKGDYSQAIVYMKKCIRIDSIGNNQRGIASSLGNMGFIYIKMKDYLNARLFCQKSVDLAIKVGARDIIVNGYKELSSTAVLTNDYQAAFSYHKLYAVYKDSLFNESKSKEIGKLEARYEYEKAEMERKKIEEEEQRIKKEAQERRNLLQYSGIVLVLFSLFLGIFLLARRFRKIKEQKTHRQYTRITEAVLFISFLILFEFILILLDPIIETITGGEPAGKLLINALIAGLIFPLHTFLDSKLKTTIIKTERSKWASQAKHLCWAGMLLGHYILTGFTDSTIQQSSISTSIVDSLEKQYEYAGEDTIKLKILNQLCWNYSNNNPAKSLLYASKALEIAVQLDNKLEIANFLNRIGYIYEYQGNHEKAIANYLRSLRISEQSKNKWGIAKSLNSIGTVYYYQGNYPQAIEYCKKALKTWEEQKNKEGIGSSLIWIGNIFFAQKDFQQALNHYSRSLKIYKELGHKNGISAGLNNIGLIYMEQSEYPTALEYYEKSLEINEEEDNKNGISNCLQNIGNIYSKKKKYSEANNYFIRSLNIAKIIGDKDLIKNACYHLNDLHAKQNNFKLAYKYHKQYTEIKDSLFNEEKSKEIGKLEVQHEFEMAEMERKKQEELLARIERESTSRRNNLQYTAIGIGILLLFGSLFFLGRFTIPNWLVELSVFMPFLLLFEFTLVLLDPYIEVYTQEPAYILMLNAILAGIIFPIHNLFESKLNQRIFKAKRLKIKKRMEQYRRDVEEL